MYSKPHSEITATGTVMCRFPAASAKFGSISQNISTQRAKIMKHVSQIIFCLFRFKSRDSSRQKGISQWQIKSAEPTTHHPPRIRFKYQGISSGTLPDQMMRNSAKFR